MTTVQPRSDDERAGRSPEHIEGWPPSRRFRIGLILLVAVVVVGVVVFHQSVSREEFTRIAERLHAFAGHWWAPLALIAAFVVINLTGIPGTPLTLAAGAVWGWRVGGMWVMVATMIGCAVPYFVARKGAFHVRRMLLGRFGRIYERVEDEGMTGVLVMRLIGVVPFAIISYGSGFANVRPRDYFIGTFFGVLPGVFIYTYLADSILAGLVTPGGALRRIVVAGALLATLVLTTRLIARRG